MKILGFDFSDKLIELNISKKDNIIENLKNIDKRNIKLFYVWEHDNITLECYGCDKSENNEKINSHCLPPSEKMYTLYGNIYIVSKINNNISDIDISQYGMLSYYIQEKYENIDICDYDNNIEEDESEEETSSEIPAKKKILNKSNTSQKSTIVNKDELNYDTTDY